MVAGGCSSGDKTGVYHPGSKMSKEAVGDQPKADELEMQLPSAMSPLPPEKSRLLTMLLEKKVTAGCVSVCSCLRCTAHSPAPALCALAQQWRCLQGSAARQQLFHT